MRTLTSFMMTFVFLRHSWEELPRMVSEKKSKIIGQKGNELIFIVVDVVIKQGWLQRTPSGCRHAVSHAHCKHITI